MLGEHVSLFLYTEITIKQRRNGSKNRDVTKNFL